MLVLRDPASANSIVDPDLRGLVEQRFEEICDGEEYEEEVHGYMIVVEPGDTAEDLEKESSCPILRSYIGNARFGDPDFKPVFEVLEEHAGCYEMVFVPGGGDFGIVIFIPKQAGVDPELLALCAEYAEPAP
jgi:hypothetical protein